MDSQAAVIGVGVDRPPAAANHYRPRGAVQVRFDQPGNNKKPLAPFYKPLIGSEFKVTSFGRGRKGPEGRGPRTRYQETVRFPPKDEMVC